MKLDFSKTNGLIPVIIQNNSTLKVLMLGYMNEQALAKTKKENIEPNEEEQIALELGL